MAKKQRSPFGVLRKHLADSPHPLVLVNDRRVVEYCNAACAAWLGTPVERLVGQTAPYHFESARSGAPSVAATIAPPPETCAGRAARRRIQPLSIDGGGTRWATFVPLRLDGDVSGVLVIVDQCDAESSNDPSSLDEGRSEAALLHGELAEFRRRLAKYYEIPSLIGSDPSIERVRAQVVTASVSSSRALVIGPPGSGREHVARAIYYHQAASNQGILVPLSCALLDAELLQTTIQAYVQSQPQLEVAGPLTLLLLDVDELKADAQLALMSVFGGREIKVHALATAQRPVVERATEGLFRADLAHFLSTIVISIPALRERPRDIPVLAQRFVEARNAEGGRQLSGFQEDAMDRLVQYAWPRNVDELRLVAREAFDRAAGPRITKSDLPRRFAVSEQSQKHVARPVEPIRLDATLEQFEREILSRAMQKAKGNRSRAARLVGFSRQRFVRRLAQLQIGSNEQGTET